MPTTQAFLSGFRLVAQNAYDTLERAGLRCW